MSAAPASVARAPPPSLLDWMAASARGIASLAFGQGTGNAAVAITQLRHLAVLPVDDLELDLSSRAQREFGDYELVERIGEGGMGVVYRARQRSLDRDVAIKLLAAGPWASREFIERFQREAQSAARMQHPNIVTIHEVGSADELHYFSMRLVRGQSLAAEIAGSGPFEPYRAARLLRTIAEAVDYAHSLGVLHLDLKPANVLLDENGTPHVADFGLARRLEPELAADNHEVSGTPSYMAPEQATAGVQKITVATDVWGLGAIGYELATGQPPFLSDSAQDTLKLVAGGAMRPPRELQPALPRDFAAIIEKCMAREATARYESARDLAYDLGRFLDHRPVQARPLGAPQRVWRWAQRQPYIAAFGTLFLLALVAGLVGIAWQWRRATANADLALHTLWKSRTDTAQEQIEQGDAYPALANAVANLRDMEASGDRTDAALERLRIGTVLANAPQLIDAIPVGGDSGIDALANSPDGESVAEVVDARKIRLIDVASGKQRWQVDAPPQSFGMTVFGLNRSTMELHFSDDGRRLIGQEQPGENAKSGLNPMLHPHHVDSVLIDVGAGKLVAPPKQFADFLAVDYSNNGHFALLFDRHGGVQRWRTLPWAADGALVRVANDLATRAGGVQLAGEALLTDDGATMVLADSAKLGFRSFDAATMRLQHSLHLTTDQDRASAWALRHDDKQLAIGTTSGQIAVWDLATGKAAWLHMRFNGWISRLRFSADDSRLLAVSSEFSEMGVFDTREFELVAAPVMLGNHVDPGFPADASFGPDAATVLTRDALTHAVIWQIPEPGFPLRAPVAVAPPMAGEYNRFAVASDARSHLMATSDNGLLKLWRVRWTPFIGRTAAPMVADTLRFDGHHLVAADGNRVSVFDVATGQNVGKSIALSEAPTYAGLDGNGTRLIAIAGRDLSCWNWREGKPCWPAITLPESPLRLGLAAAAPILAISTGSSEKGRFFEHVRIIDLANGEQRGMPITLRGPLGALRLSNDGRRLLVFEYRNIFSADSNVLRVIDTRQAKVALNLVHTDKTPTRTDGTGQSVARNQSHHEATQVRIVDARFAGDGSIWSLSGSTGWGEGPDPKLWHWDANGRPTGKPIGVGGEGGLVPLPHGRGVFEMSSATLFARDGTAKVLSAVPAINNRITVGAVSPDGRLLALGLLDGVALFVIDRNQQLVPDLNLALPNHDAVQQLAFAPGGSRLVGRTVAGHWFQWRIVADARPVAAIARDLALRDLTNRDSVGQPGVAPPSVEERRALHAVDTGPAPQPPSAPAPVNATVAAPVADPRYAPLDLDPIANVEPRTPMNRAARVPQHPQALPTLPRGLQRYAGVDFRLGRAVQLSGTPLSLLNTPFPAQSRMLPIAPQRIAAVDALVLQFAFISGEVGAVRLHYADGSERVLTILNDRDTRGVLDIRPTGTSGRRVGWFGTFAAALHGWGFEQMGEMPLLASFVVHLQNPEPNRPVVAISLEAPPNASPGLLFLALTLEPANRSGTPGKAPP